MPQKSVCLLKLQRVHFLLFCETFSRHDFTFFNVILNKMRNNYYSQSKTPFSSVAFPQRRRDINRSLLSKLLFSLWWRALWNNNYLNERTNKEFHWGRYRGVDIEIFSWVNHAVINFDFFFNEMVQVSSTILVQNVGETGVEIAALQAGLCPTHE